MRETRQPISGGNKVEHRNFPTSKSMFPARGAYSLEALRNTAAQADFMRAYKAGGRIDWGNRPADYVRLVKNYLDQGYKPWAAHHATLDTLKSK